MPRIDVTMQGVGRQFAKMASEIETLLIEKQILIEKINELTSPPAEVPPPKELEKK